MLVFQTNPVGVELFSYYFGGAQSKGFATLRNERWPRKVPRFSVLFGYLTK